MYFLDESYIKGPKICAFTLTPKQDLYCLFKLQGILAEQKKTASRAGGFPNQDNIKSVVGKH